MDESATHCGYVALLGRPNVGKSTLLNHVLRQKIAITSRKPQTTRENLLGVDTDGAYQALYLDTPGIHEQEAKTSKALNSYMVNAAKSVLGDVDLRVMLAEAGRWTTQDETVAGLLRTVGKPSVLVLSKVDLVARKETLLPQMATLHERGLFEHIIPMSALRGDGIDEFRRVVFDYLPESPHLYAPDEITDRSERALAAEIVREKLMRQLGDEIPHSAAVTIERWDERPELVEIHAEIYVERAGQKRIVIGNQGQRLKLIGQEARGDIERLLDRKVMLHLWVKVRKGWTNDARQLKRLGYD